MTIDTEESLREVYRPPAAQAGQKVLDHLDIHCRNFIALSPFYVISSSRADGRAPPRAAILPDRWRTSPTIRRWCFRTGRGTAKWTR